MAKVNFQSFFRTFSLCFIDLKTLLMNNNFIETVDIEVFAYFEKLEEFNLSNNNIKSLFTFVEPRGNIVSCNFGI